ncbi:MAG: hypothetical protein JXL97_07560 [Bacteroidales bacterium]|nr:hypothetical protein [Bacteroidales bacterium]
MKKTLLTILSIALVFVFSCKNTESSDEQTNTENNQEVLNSDNSNTKNSQVSYDFKELSFSESEISNDLYTGNIIDGKKWQDKAGINYLVLSEKTTTKAQQNSNDMKSYEIHGYHYIDNDGKFELIREVKDFQNDCDLILDCGLCENSLEITDLDGDNYGEATFMYYLYCAMDLSPSTVKLMLLENGEKYPIRGESYVNYGPEGMGGAINLGTEFTNAPSEFKDFATNKWNSIIYKMSNITPEYKLLEQFKGITFAGVEPNWTVKLGVYGVTLTQMGVGDIYLEYTSIGQTGDGTINITAKTGNKYYDFNIKKETCTDGMSDNKYSYSIEVLKDGGNLYGCCCKN